MIAWRLDHAARCDALKYDPMRYAKPALLASRRATITQLVAALSLVLNGYVPATNSAARRSTCISAPGARLSGLAAVRDLRRTTPYYVTTGEAGRPCAPVARTLFGKGPADQVQPGGIIAAGMC